MRRRVHLPPQNLCSVKDLHPASPGSTCQFVLEPPPIKLITLGKQEGAGTDFQPSLDLVVVFVTHEEAQSLLTDMRFAQVVA